MLLMSSLYKRISTGSKTADFVQILYFKWRTSAFLTIYYHLKYVRTFLKLCKYQMINETHTIESYFAVGVVFYLLKMKIK